MIFAEAITDPQQYKKFTSSVSVPVLANMTEFGKSPLMTTEQLKDAGVAMVLYPLSAFRAMSLAAESVFAAIRNEGTQASMTPKMQTRDRLYEVLDYHHYEQIMDQLIKDKS